MATMTRTQMEAEIAAGKAVVFGHPGRVITDVDDLPTQEEIDDYDWFPDESVAVSVGDVTVGGDIDVTPETPAGNDYLPVRLTDGSAFYTVQQRGSLTNRSGTITEGGTAQTLAAANSSRKYLFVQNLSSENLWINFTTAAAQNQPSLRLAPGDSFVMEDLFVSTEAVSIIGATTGSAFAAKEG